MPADRHDEPGRLTLTAAWTGLAAALVASILGVAAVAVVWLPASGGTGSADSAIRAGILTFLASLHGGVTVDGVDVAFLPLGLTFLVGFLAWRSGSALAAAADERGMDDPVGLLRAGAVQSATFAAVCGLLAGFSPLGTSSVSIASAGIAGFVLFSLTGGVALVRNTVLSDDLTQMIPRWVGNGVRAAATVLGVYLGAGALLVAGSVVVHHDRVQALSAQVGGGWSSIPVLLLGILAAPNAVIAGAGYLSGAGFAFGTDTTVGLTSTTHGTVPAFPVLGALPDGHAATLPVWLLAGITPVLAGVAVALLARRVAQTWVDRWSDVAVGVAGAAVVGALLAWQGGGSIGGGRLSAVGASPWQFGLALVLGVGAVAAAVLGSVQVFEQVRAPERSARPGFRATIAGLASVKAHDDGRAADDRSQDDELPDDLDADDLDAGNLDADDLDADDLDAQKTDDLRAEEPRKGKRLAG